MRKKDNYVLVLIYRYIHNTKPMYHATNIINIDDKYVTLVNDDRRSVYTTKPISYLYKILYRTVSSDRAFRYIQYLKYKRYNLRSRQRYYTNIHYTFPNMYLVEK